MAQNVEKCGNLKEGDYCTVEEDCGANSQFKPMFCSTDESTSSIGSASSSDSELLDDASSSSSSSSSSTCSSPETRLRHGFLSVPMASKPTTKKGLSRYYPGKARTFTSLSDVKCVEDLAKKEIRFVKRGRRTPYQSPKAGILKKNTRGSGSANCLLSKNFGHLPDPMNGMLPCSSVEPSSAVEPGEQCPRAWPVPLSLRRARLNQAPSHFSYR